ncbi:hypothetical protein LBC_02460 [Campylobacter sp. 19-13652]|nr:hypothetical protein LBC_02460 [Campylobacter sp. 19-13652]
MNSLAQILGMHKSSILKIMPTLQDNMKIPKAYISHDFDGFHEHIRTIFAHFIYKTILSIIY